MRPTPAFGSSRRAGTGAGRGGDCPRQPGPRHRGPHARHGRGRRAAGARPGRLKGGEAMLTPEEFRQLDIEPEGLMYEAFCLLWRWQILFPPFLEKELETLRAHVSEADMAELRARLMELRVLLLHLLL